MQNPPPLGGLDPADLLQQGVADDTFVGGEPSSFDPPPIEDLAAIFPQFEILELIGKGGMGAVYKVRQKDLDRIVALKILPPASGRSPEISNRFTREAKALAKLNHPGIVTLHEFGQQDGLYFILMEFVDGVNLAQLMKTGRISPREALAIIPQICDALQCAHDQGIVHRDIKPENILLDRLGRVKVADFGIAKVVAAVSDRRTDDELPQPAATADATLAGKIIGTPAYMAPEQIAHPADVDHRADIYALGVVFYQMLTGELPGKRLEAPSTKVHIDVRLDEIVLRAMEQDPELRFQHASVMRTHVDDLGAVPIESPNDKRGPIKSTATGKWLAIIGACMQAGTLIGMIGAVTGMRKPFTTIGEVLFSTAAGMAVGLIGVMLIFVSLLVCRYRAAWLYWFLFIYGAISLFVIPVGTIIGIAFLVYSLTNRNEFLDPGMERNQDAEGQSLAARAKSIPSQSENPRPNTHVDSSAITSLILAIASFILGPFGSLPAVIFGHRSLSKIKKNPLLTGCGFAIGGLVIGYLNLVMCLLSLLFCLFLKPEIKDTRVSTTPPRASIVEPLAAPSPPHHEGSPLLMTEFGEFKSEESPWTIHVSAEDRTVLFSRKAGTSGVGVNISPDKWRAQKGWFAFIEDEYHAWAYNGDERLMLVEVTTEQSTLYETPNIFRRVPDAIISRVSQSTRDGIGRGKSGKKQEEKARAIAQAEADASSTVEARPIAPTPTTTAPVNLAEEYVDTELAAAKARASYHEGNSDRVAVENRLKLMLENHPELPNEQSRAVATQRQVALVAEINELSKQFGPGHPRIIELNRQLDALARLPEFSVPQVASQVAREILSRDLPPGNRLEVRLVTPGDAAAKVVKEEREGHPGEDIPVSDQVIVCDQHIQQASLRKVDGGFDLNITLNEVGAQRMAEATKSGFGNLRLAILLDGKVKSAPLIQNQLGKGFVISGIKNFDEYMDLYRSFPCWEAQKNSLDAARWLLMVDDGKYAESYAAASALMHKSVTAKQWEVVLDAVRQPLGRMTSRCPQKCQEVKSLPGVPDGEYRLLLFNTSFANKQEAVETVTFVKEEDGVWRAAGYFIR